MIKWIFFCWMLLIASREFIFYPPSNWNSLSFQKQIALINSMIQDICYEIGEKGESYDFLNDCKITSINTFMKGIEIKFTCNTDKKRDTEI